MVVVWLVLMLFMVGLCYSRVLWLFCLMLFYLNCLIVEMV